MERLIRVRHLPTGIVRIEASAAERDALAARFGICAVHSLLAEVELEAGGGGTVRADGLLNARIEQECAVSQEPFATTINEPLALVFTPNMEQPAAPDDEVELDTEALDEIGYAGDSFDVGEAVAQTLGLAIDPYAVGPQADAARAEAGIVSDEAPTGTLAEALANLKLN
nr:DUF177 domain-containing protein [Porphyrobacter sp. GA68]